MHRPVQLLPRSTSCSIQVENLFGPSVSDCYGGLDFTLLFEEAFLSIAPSSAFFMASAARIFYLRNKKPKLLRGWLYWAKIVESPLFKW